MPPPGTRARAPVRPATAYPQAMRLADTPVPARASGDADASVRPARPGQAPASAALAKNTGPAGNVMPADSTVPPDGNAAFAAAVAALEAGRCAVADARDDLEFEDWPAPKRLAPLAVAVAVTACRPGDEEAGTGRLILLYDPAGRDGWTGAFRVVVQVNADVEEEMAADPLLGEVGWSWLTDALDLHAPGYSSPSGTVTRVITEGYGAKADDPPSTGFELRASWCPDDADVADEVCGAVLAWSDVLAAAAGLPAQPPGTRALAQRAQRAQRAQPASRGTAPGPGRHR